MKRHGKLSWGKDIRVAMTIQEAEILLANHNKKVPAKEFPWRFPTAVELKTSIHSTPDDEPFAGATYFCLPKIGTDFVQVVSLQGSSGIDNLLSLHNVRFVRTI